MMKMIYNMIFGHVNATGTSHKYHVILIASSMIPLYSLGQDN